MKTISSILLLGFLLAGCDGGAEPARPPAESASAGRASAPSIAESATTRKAAQVVAAARAQVGVTTGYDPAYVRIPFPNGDVPRATGVCADVVVRALRAVGQDLQALVNADMKANFAKYPQKWGLRKPDPNIDHRRVANLMKWFERQGKSVPLASADGKTEERKNGTTADQRTTGRENGTTPDQRTGGRKNGTTEDTGTTGRKNGTAAGSPKSAIENRQSEIPWRPGDIVAWDLNGNGLLHIGVVSDAKSADGRRFLVVHNIGQGAREEDVLNSWKIIGHYRPFP